MLKHIGTTDEGDRIALPDDAVTQGFAILARRRSGKSTLAGVIEETFCARGDPWVCLDPVSAHWGILYRDDHGQPGKPSGYDVMIVGGKQGHVPLDEHAGAQLAEIIVDTDINCIIDLGAESHNAQQRFVADFANKLLELNQTPRHVLFEEAHEFVPQMLVWDNQKLVRGAVSRLIRNGGGRGIGFTLITQRPAAVAKDVLEMIDNLFVLRMSGPNDLNAVKAWFEHNVGGKDELLAILRSLPAFKPGEAWLCSPDWLQQIVRLQVRMRETYHAGRTPKRGEQPVDPKKVELGKVIERFRAAATKRQIAIKAERDKDAEILQLRRELAGAKKKAPGPPDEKIIEHRVAVRERELREEYGAIERQRAALERVIGTAADELAGVAERMRKATNGGIPAPAPAAKVSAPVSTPRRIAREATPRVDVSAGVSSGGEGLSRSQQAILDALASLETLGVGAPNKSVVAVFAGASPTSGGYFKNCASLLAANLVAYPQPGALALTPNGRAQARYGDAIATLEGLHDAWCERVSAAEAKILRAVIARYPDDVHKDELAGEVDVSPTSGGYFKNLGRLRALGAVDYPAPGRVVATELIFPEGLA